MSVKQESLSTGKIPIRLRENPIVDCVIEMRFSATTESAGDVLPGILFQKFGKQFPKIERTHTADLPRPIRMSDPNLRALPVVLLEGEGARVGVGDTGLQLVFRRPYPGWSVVQALAQSVFGHALESGVITSGERLSICYKNLISQREDEYDLSPLEIDFRIGRNLKPRGPGTNLRTEFELEGTVSIVQIQSGVRIAASALGFKPEPDSFSGLLVSVDTILAGSFNSQSELNERLRKIHDIEKSIFFSVVTEDTVKRLGPEWE